MAQVPQGPRPSHSAHVPFGPHGIQLIGRQAVVMHNRLLRDPTQMNQLASAGEQFLSKTRAGTRAKGISPDPPRRRYSGQPARARGPS
jgi:hypothetical protein